MTGSIVLIGFMGSGKSSVGRLLALDTGFEFIDTDSLIEQTAGMPISRIFEEKGEEEFRRMESETLLGLQGREKLVVSTGGGVILRPGNRELLRKVGFVVWLLASEEEIFARVSRNRNRPLLRTPDPRRTIHELLEQRNALYGEASDFAMDTTGIRRHKVAKEILRRAAQYYADPSKPSVA